MTPNLDPYLALLGAFADGNVDAATFESAFLQLYLGQEGIWPEHVFNILDTLFAEVDDYTADPDLRRRAGGLDDEELRALTLLALLKLREWLDDAQIS